MIQVEYLRSPEAVELAGEDTVGLIPLGAIEQHGPHLPLATDAIIARHLAGEIAERLEQPTFVAPVLPAGMSWHHLHFPGTVHLPEEVVAGFVRAWVDAFTRLGITRIALFSAHGGNFALLEKLAAEYRASSSPATLIAYTDLRRYIAVMTGAAAETGLTVPATDAHAGGLETSQMLYLWGPDRIKVPEQLEGCYVDEEPGWLDRLMADGVHALSPVGVLGQPAGASAEAGKAICAALVDELVAWMVEGLGATDLRSAE